MTVATDDENNVLKWRKGQCLSVAKDNTNILDDGMWCHIFGFLVNSPVVRNRQDQTPTNGVWVKDARKLYSLLTSVCKTWKGICDNNNLTSIFGFINANLSALPVCQVIPHIHWMIKHKTSIGALTFYADYDDFPLLIQLLNTCDTSNLSIVRARCNTIHAAGRRGDKFTDMRCEYLHQRKVPIGHGRCYSQWVNEAYLVQKENEIVDLIDPGPCVTFEDKCKALNIPYSKSCPMLLDLHDAIAFNCTDLSELLINFDIPEGTTETEFCKYVSKNLLSRDLKCKLHLSLSLRSGMISNVLNKALENLINLKELSISCTCIGRIHLVSEHLRSLDVSHLPKATFISGNLPNLKTLKYSGSVYGNGIVPVFLDDVKMQRCIDQSVSDRIYKYRAGDVRIHRLTIPPECHIITDSLQPWNLKQFIGADLI